MIDVVVCCFVVTGRVQRVLGFRETPGAMGMTTST